MIKVVISSPGVVTLAWQDVFLLLFWNAGRSYHGRAGQSCSRRNNEAGGERDCGSPPGDVSEGRRDPGAQEKSEADGA